MHEEDNQMYDGPQTIGFNGHSLPVLAERIAVLIGLPARMRDNSYWGNYFCFALNDNDDHRLVPNEAPTSDIGLADPAEPDFLDWSIIFWVHPGYESEALTQALLSIEGATLLRPAT